MPAARTRRRDMGAACRCLSALILHPMLPPLSRGQYLTCRQEVSMLLLDEEAEAAVAEVKVVVLEEDVVEVLQVVGEELTEIQVLAATPGVRAQHGGTRVM